MGTVKFQDVPQYSWLSDWCFLLAERNGADGFVYLLKQSLTYISIEKFLKRTYGTKPFFSKKTIGIAVNSIQGIQCWLACAFVRLEFVPENYDRCRPLATNTVWTAVT